MKYLYSSLEVDPDMFVWECLERVLREILFYGVQHAIVAEKIGFLKI